MVILKLRNLRWIRGCHRGRVAAILAVSCAVLPLAIGCGGPRMTTPSVDPATLSDVAFQAYLAELDVVTVDEACRAMLILADGEDTSRTFEERKRKLESRGILRAEWGLQPEHVIDAGSLSYMVCQICRIRGGVNLNVFGRLGLGDRRYALRELMYHGLLDDRVDYQYMTGAAVVSVLAKADALMEKRGLYETQIIQLDDATDRDQFGNLIVPAAP